MGRAFEYRRKAKEKRWGQMSRIFPKLGKAITMAAKDGGPDPEMNASLRTAIQNAKAANMPKNNIESAIDRASGKDATSYTEINYEGKGPHGSLVFIECATDNNNRTVANMKAIFARNSGSMAPTGSLEYMFNRKAVIEFEKPDDLDLEDLELELIDAGLEEFEEDGKTVYAYGDYRSFGSLSAAFEGQNIAITTSKLERVPTTPIEVSDDQMADIEKLIDKLEEDDDVQAVFSNIG